MTPPDGSRVPAETSTAEPDHQLPAAGESTAAEGAGGGLGARRGGNGADAHARGEATGDHRIAGSHPPDEFRRAGIGDLVRDLANDTRLLVQQEIELAKMEVAATIKRVVKDSAWIGVGAAVAAVGGLVLVVALALLLGALLDSYWLGTLITGGLLLLIGGLAAWKGIRDLKKGGLMPRGSVESLTASRDWAQREAEEFKTALTEERR